MKFFVDSCDIESIKYWFNIGVGEGITTNPLIIKKQGISDVDSHLIKMVAAANGAPVSIQVSGKDRESILKQAKKFASLGENIVIKVPVVDADGKSLLPIIKELSDEGYAINATACMMAPQAIMAAKAGARYVSLFFGRISDQGADPVEQIASVRNWIDEVGSDTEIIVGSIRTVFAITSAAIGRPHICTVTPAILQKCTVHEMSKHTAAEFDNAATKINV
ncbi:transaldolase family protein [Aureispira anguillae]|uniref:Transaldolase n=1 Tax=Aureispira anguillae TaxID=2864201 RepID=A0A915YEE5_9BACT|nr:transaldolase family protein [Aureispira anguillae]BDS11597.1 hypothetical protein AsAng_0023110 [Aureispira anguillae]